VALIEERRVSSQTEAARLLGVSPKTVNKVVLAYGLPMRYVRPVRATLTCKICSREYRSTARSRDGVCVPCQWASRRGESRSDAEANVQLTSKPQDTQEPTRDRLLHLIQQGQVASQAGAARALGVSRQLVSRIVLAEGLDLRIPRSAQLHVMYCRACGKRYVPSACSSAGVCLLCQAGAPRGNLEIVCPRCGSTRTMRPSSIRARKTALCKPCQSRMPRELYELEEQRFLSASTSN